MVSRECEGYSPLTVQQHGRLLAVGIDARLVPGPSVLSSTARSYSNVPVTLRGRSWWLWCPSTKDASRGRAGNARSPVESLSRLSLETPGWLMGEVWADRAALTVPLRTVLWETESCGQSLPPGGTTKVQLCSAIRSAQHRTRLTQMHLLRTTQLRGKRTSVSVNFSHEGECACRGSSAVSCPFPGVPRPILGDFSHTQESVTHTGTGSLD
jgi:hypothetical protein